MYLGVDEMTEDPIATLVKTLAETVVSRDNKTKQLKVLMSEEDLEQAHRTSKRLGVSTGYLVRSLLAVAASSLDLQPSSAMSHKGKDEDRSYTHQGNS